jgi:hypothetical protein
LSTTNPTWTDPGANLGLCGERQVANHLSHGTSLIWVLHYHNYIIINVWKTLQFTDWTHPQTISPVGLAACWTSSLLDFQVEQAV